MKDISVEQAKEDGVATRHSDMENGERRYRLVGDDGSAYIRTIADKGCWENSHYHKHCSEMYVLQKGTAIICELENGKLCANKLQPQDHYIIKPLSPHNLYMCEGAIMHTVKYGDCEPDDWYAAEELDRLIQKMSEEELQSHS